MECSRTKNLSFLILYFSFLAWSISGFGNSSEIRTHPVTSGFQQTGETPFAPGNEMHPGIPHIPSVRESNCVPQNQNQRRAEALKKQREAQIKRLAQTFMPNGKLSIMHKGAVQKGRSMDNPWVVKTSHYIVKTDISKKASGEIALLMELLFHSFIQSPVYNVDTRNLDRLPVLVPKNRAEFEQIVSSFTRVSSGVRGLYLKGSRDNKLVAYYFHSNDMKLHNVLLHEGTHQFNDLITKSKLPLWLEEGLASYFEFSRFRNMRLIEGRVNKARLKNIQRALRNPEYAKKLTLELSQLMRKKRFNAHNYSQAWSFVHFLLQSNQGEFIPRLREYLKYYKQPNVNPDPVKLFKRIFELHPDKLKPYWKKYVLELGY